MNFFNISSIIFESYSKSFIKENRYSNINDRLVKHYTALLNLLTCILNKNNTALDKKTKVKHTYENLFASTKI